MMIQTLLACEVGGYVDAVFSNHSLSLLRYRVPLVLSEETGEEGEERRASDSCSEQQQQWWGEEEKLSSENLDCS
jgi:hypothetical protein